MGLSTIWGGGLARPRRGGAPITCPATRGLQVLIRRELDEAAKVLGERIRTDEASAEDYFELGAILMRKKLYSQAVKNLEKCRSMYQGNEPELAQVLNALGFAYASLERAELAIATYREAVRLQPGYTIAWNNLGDALEKKKDYA